MRRRIAVLALALVSGSAAGAQSDASSPWPVGSRVRVTKAPKGTVVGELTEVRGNTLVIRTDGVAFRPWTRIHVDSAARLEISRGRYVSPKRVMTGAFGGAAGSVILLTVLTRFSVASCTVGGCGSDDVPYAAAAGLGAAAGALLGALHIADRWEELPKPARVGVTPDLRGGRIALSFTFR